MKRVLLFLVLVCTANAIMAQYVYTINADSVKITNHCDTAELIIENHTQNVSGFLFNKGRGRTEFRKVAITLNDSTYLLGTDTLHTGRPSFWRESNEHQFGQSIYNTNPGYIGIGTDNPQRTVDINGSLRVRSGILDFSIGGYTGIRQTCLSTHMFNACGTVGYISLGFDTVTGVATAHPDPLTVRQKNLSVGIGNNNPEARLHIRSTGVTDTISTLQADNAAGTSLLRLLDNGNLGIHRLKPAVLLDLPGPVNIDDTSSYRINYRPVLSIKDPAPDGYSSLYVGDSSGVDNTGANNTLVGGRAGLNNLGGECTFLGYATGHDSEGEKNTFVGAYSGQNNTVDGLSTPPGHNSFMGYASGQYSSGNSNTFLGTYAGSSNTGYNNTFAGIEAGSFNNGAFNLLLGSQAGSNNTGLSNVLLGPGTGIFNTGSYNVLIGSDAGSQNNGYNNVCLGLRAGYANQGYNNIFIGNSTGYEPAYGSSLSTNNLTLIGSGAIIANTPGISNATAIGANAIVKTSNTLVFGDGAVNKWVFNSNANPPAGAALVVGSGSSNGNGAYLTTGGVWTNASDRDKKENFDDVDTQELLQKIAMLPVSRWNYKGLSEQHIGPVAQDFHRLFQLGSDDKTISTIDPAGIALAGIQGLYSNWQESKKTAEDQQTTIKNLQEQLKQQNKELEDLKQQMNELKKLMGK